MVGVRPTTLVGHPRTNHQSVMEHGVSDQPTSSDISNQSPKCYGIWACRRIPVLALKAKAGFREQVRGAGLPRPFDGRITQARVRQMSSADGFLLEACVPRRTVQSQEIPPSIQ